MQCQVYITYTSGPCYTCHQGAYFNLYANISARTLIAHSSGTTLPSQLPHPRSCDSGISSLLSSLTLCPPGIFVFFAECGVQCAVSWCSSVAGRLRVARTGVSCLPATVDERGLAGLVAGRRGLAVFLATGAPALAMTILIATRGRSSRSILLTSSSLTRVHLIAGSVSMHCAGPSGLCLVATCCLRPRMPVKNDLSSVSHFTLALAPHIAQETACQTFSPRRHTMLL